MRVWNRERRREINYIVKITWDQYESIRSLESSVTVRWSGTRPGWCWRASRWWWPAGRSIPPLGWRSWSVPLTSDESHWSWHLDGRWCSQSTVRINRDTSCYWLHFSQTRVFALVPVTSSVNRQLYILNDKQSKTILNSISLNDTLLKMHRS